MTNSTPAVAVKEREPLASDCLSGEARMVLDSLKLGWESNGDIVTIGAYKNKKTSIDRFVSDVRSKGAATREIFNAYFAQFPIPVSLVTGDDLIDTFNDHRPGSCMRYEKFNPMLRMYADNPDIVQCLRWRKSEHAAIQSDMSGLVWVGGADKGYPILLDRVYAEGIREGMMPYLVDSVMDLLKSRFPGREIAYIWGHSGSSMFWGMNGVRHTMYKYEQPVEYHIPYHNDRIPYMDSVMHGLLYEADEGGIMIKLSNREFRNSRQCRSSECTALPAPKISRCCIYGTRVPEGCGFEYDGRLYGEKAFDELFTLCSYNHEYALKSDIVNFTYRDADGSLVKATATARVINYDFYEVATATRFGEAVRYFPANRAINLHGVPDAAYVDSIEVLPSRTPPTEDGAMSYRFVACEYSAHDAVPMEMAEWSEILSAWVEKERKAEWESIMVGYAEDLLGCPSKSVGNGLAIVVHLQNGNPVWSVFHKATQRCIIEALKSSAEADKASVVFVESLQARFPAVLPKLAALTDVNSPDWDIGCHGAVTVASSIARSSL